MPLRALINGTEYLAPGISSKQWEFLRERVRSHEYSLVLPCCRSRGFLRTSSRGLFHFVHAPRSTCVHRHESPLTLQISTAIIRAAMELKYPATADVMAAGMRIPVVITLPEKEAKLAFLGYDRKYSLKNIPSLHAKLLSAKIRPCWLIYESSLTAKDPSPNNGPLLGEIPCFLISSAGDQVDLPGRMNFPLVTFLSALLRGAYHYRAVYRIRNPELVSVLLYRMPCPSCQKEVFVYNLSGRHHSICGVELDAMDLDRYRPEVLAAFRKSMQVKNLPFGHVEWGAGENKTPQAAVLECIHCGKPIYESRIRAFLRQHSGEMADSFGETIRWKERLTLPEPHWCFSIGDGLC